MENQDYKQWLENQKYQASTITAQLHRKGRVEEHYGNLDEHFNNDQLISLISELSYSKDDQRNQLPNPTKIPFKGDPYTNLASYRDAVKRFLKYKLDESILIDDEEVPDISLDDLNNNFTETNQSLSLERDMQATLRLSINDLEVGLVITDEGAERSVDSGFIDITAKDRDGITVVIELKTGKANQKAIAQILSYMGDIVSEEDGNQVRGILVASDFDPKAIAAARMVPTLKLKKYSVQFAFMDAVV
jgi:hypothetical protein